MRSNMIYNSNKEDFHRSVIQIQYSDFIEIMILYIKDSSKKLTLYPYFLCLGVCFVILIYVYSNDAISVGMSYLYRSGRIVWQQQYNKKQYDVRICLHKMHVSCHVASFLFAPLQIRSLARNCDENYTTNYAYHG